MTHLQRAHREVTYSTVLHDYPLVRDEQFLQRVDNAPEVALVLVVVKLPLGIQHVVHGHQVILSWGSKEMGHGVKNRWLVVQATSMASNWGISYGSSWGGQGGTNPNKRPVASCCTKDKLPGLGRRPRTELNTLDSPGGHPTKQGY